MTADGSGEGHTVVGIDGASRGWMAIVRTDDAAPEAHLLDTIAEIDDVAPGAAVVGIDMPIGLLDDRVRAADIAARAAAGPRRNSVFVTPVRAAIEASTYGDASAINRARTGKGISRQAYGLRTKILEVERWLDDTSAHRQGRVVEIHPEVSFAMLLGHPPLATKKSWHGMVERRRALADAGFDLGGIDERVGAAVAIDDVLDAAVVAWSARRVRDGTAICLPDPPELDHRGRPVAVWA